MKKYLKSVNILTLFLASIMMASSVGGAQKSKKAPFLVVIDPGHGGSDHGAAFGKGKNRLHEKDLTLQLARKVAKQLQKRKIRAVLTRSVDKEIELNERTAIANRLKADVFISIHMNSHHRSHRIGGVETFILNTTNNKTSSRLASMENNVLNGSVADAFQKAEVGLILKDLMLNANLESSKLLACNVQQKLARVRGLRDRGVKQAMFYVLLGADMPSILLEAGFLTHSKDRARLTSEKGQTLIASQIARAVNDFKNLKSAHRSQKVRQILSKCKVN